MPNRLKTHRAPVLNARPHMIHTHRGSATQRGYGARWRRLREAVLCERLYCADPFGHHRNLVLAEVVDHIVPLSAGGTNDESNLQCLCAACHSRKTVLHDGGFGREKQGLCVAPTHEEAHGEAYGSSGESSGKLTEAHRSSGECSGECSAKLTEAHGEAHESSGESLEKLGAAQTSSGKLRGELREAHR